MILDPAEKMIKIIHVNDGRWADLPRMQNDDNWPGELTVVCINQSSDGAGIFIKGDILSAFYIFAIPAANTSYNTHMSVQ
jgi:hypothetical protein